MREQSSGAIVMTTSSSGLYGNFGQSNYGAAKMALVGLMNVLCLEGEKYNIRINCIAPIASTGMTTELLETDQHQVLTPESVSPGVLFLLGPNGPNRTILCAGGGSYAVTHLYETQGRYLPVGARTPEGIANAFSAIASPEHEAPFVQGNQQTEKFVAMARAQS